MALSKATARVHGITSSGKQDEVVLLGSTPTAEVQVKEVSVKAFLDTGSLLQSSPWNCSWRYWQGNDQSMLVLRNGEWPLKVDWSRQP